MQKRFWCCKGSLLRIIFVKVVSRTWIKNREIEDDWYFFIFYKFSYMTHKEINCYRNRSRYKTEEKLEVAFSKIEVDHSLVISHLLVSRWAQVLCTLKIYSIYHWICVWLINRFLFFFFFPWKKVCLFSIILKNYK